MSTVFGTWPRYFVRPEDEPDEGGRVPLLVDLAHLHIVPPIAPMNVVSLNASVAPARLAHPGGATMRKTYDYDDHIHEVAGPTLDQQHRAAEWRRLLIALICTGALAGALLLGIALVQIVTGEAR